MKEYTTTAETNNFIVLDKYTKYNQLVSVTHKLKLIINH